MAHSKLTTCFPFTGLWHIVSMNTWDEEYWIHGLATGYTGC